MVCNPLCKQSGDLRGAGPVQGSLRVGRRDTSVRGARSQRAVRARRRAGGCRDAVGARIAGGAIPGTTCARAFASAICRPTNTGPGTGSRAGLRGIPDPAVHQGRDTAFTGQKKGKRLGQLSPPELAVANSLLAASSSCATVRLVSIPQATCVPDAPRLEDVLPARIDHQHRPRPRGSARVGTTSALPDAVTRCAMMSHPHSYTSQP